MRVIRVGSRDSKLAIIQAEMVIKAIESCNQNIKTELITMKTLGDKILDVSLDKIGGKGLFVKELDDALLDQRVDITVHSFKDMPMKIQEELPIVALSRREDPRDVLIFPTGVIDEKKSIGCSSKRRVLQLLDLGFTESTSLRGNVITRLGKLDAGEYSAIVLAAAGIIRLGLEERIIKYFSVEEIIPAACQGIIAVQARKGENVDFLKGFHSPESQIMADAERAFTRTLNGGCSSPIAAYAQLENNQLTLTGLYVDEESGEKRRGYLKGELKDAHQIGVALALRLKEGVSI